MAKHYRVWQRNDGVTVLMDKSEYFTANIFTKHGLTVAHEFTVSTWEEAKKTYKKWKEENVQNYTSRNAEI